MQERHAKGVASKRGVAAERAVSGGVAPGGGGARSREGGGVQGVGKGAEVSVRETLTVGFTGGQKDREVAGEGGEEEEDRSGWYICGLMLLYMWPHTAVTCPHTAIYVSSCCYVCALILLYVCPHTAVYVASCCIRVLLLLYMCPHTAL